MIDLLMKYSVYGAVILGIQAGYPLMQYMQRRQTAAALFRCAVFSALSVISVLLFASFEKAVSGRGFSIGAVSTYGVYLFAPCLLYAVYRQDRRCIFDSYAVYVIPSQFLQRIRCLMNGCCGGTPIGSTGLHWPVREAELLFYAVMLFVLMKTFRKNGGFTGELFPVLMMSYGVFRFAEEFFREGNTLFHLAHLWSLISVLIGYSIYIEIRKHKKQGDHLC
ncbi:MAG: prolipoprotein diacylglyceryl transferase [Solobacterium sp.]|nr:prolipoprotein diacylglyceryl transferase [Solobacterium sp.]